MSADFIIECEWPNAILGMCVYFELRAPREVAVQQGTACGVRSGRRGRLAALGQLPGSWIWFTELSRGLEYRIEGYSSIVRG